MFLRVPETATRLTDTDFERAPLAFNRRNKLFISDGKHNSISEDIG